MSFALKRACLKELATSLRQGTPSITKHARRLHPLAGLGDWNALRGHAHPVTANLVPIVIEQTVCHGAHAADDLSLKYSAGPGRTKL